MNTQENSVNKWSALISVNLSYLLTNLALSSINIALPSMGKDLSANAVTLNWIATIYPLASAVFLVPVAKLADLYGRKRVFLLGNILFAIASFLVIFCSDSLTVILLRAIQGIGGAMVYGTGLTIITLVFPPDFRGKAFGITVAASYLGMSIGPFVGGLLTYHLGWKSIFLLNVPFGLMIVFFSLWKLKGEWTETGSAKFDHVGSLLYAVMIFSIMYGFSLLPHGSSALLIGVGIAAVIVFIQWEKKTSHPVLNINLFRTNRIFSLSSIASFINYSATFAVGFLLSFFLQHIKGFSPQHAGIIMVSQPLVQAVLSPVAGRISDRVEPKFVATSGMILTMAGLFLLASIHQDTSTAFIVTCLVLLGIGTAFFIPPNINAMIGSVEKEHYSTAASLVPTLRLLGQVFSMGMTLLVFAVYLGRVEISPACYPRLLMSIKMAFIAFGIFCIGGTLASFTRGTIRKS